MHFLQASKHACEHVNEYVNFGAISLQTTDIYLCALTHTKLNGIHAHLCTHNSIITCTLIPYPRTDLYSCMHVRAKSKISSVHRPTLARAVVFMSLPNSLQGQQKRNAMTRTICQGVHQSVNQWITITQSTNH